LPDGSLLRRTVWVSVSFISASSSPLLCEVRPPSPLQLTPQLYAGLHQLDQQHHHHQRTAVERRIRSGQPMKQERVYGHVYGVEASGPVSWRIMDHPKSFDRSGHRREPANLVMPSCSIRRIHCSSWTGYCCRTSQRHHSRGVKCCQDYPHGSY